MSGSLETYLRMAWIAFKAEDNLRTCPFVFKEWVQRFQQKRFKTSRRLGELCLKASVTMKVHLVLYKFISSVYRNVDTRNVKRHVLEDE